MVNSQQCPVLPRLGSHHSASVKTGFGTRDFQIGRLTFLRRADDDAITSGFGGVQRHIGHAQKGIGVTGMIRKQCDPE